MKIEDAIKHIEYCARHTAWPVYQEAYRMALAALREQQWREQIWHDAKDDPPKTPGLYYGKKDNTNSMYAVNFRDGIWTLYYDRAQEVNIIQWAEFAMFGPSAGGRQISKDLQDSGFENVTQLLDAYKEIKINRSITQQKAEKSGQMVPGRWISVKDGLPDDEQDVLLFTETVETYGRHGERKKIYHNIFYGYCDSGEWLTSYCHGCEYIRAMNEKFPDEHIEVVYWMPLPEPPGTYRRRPEKEN